MRKKQALRRILSHGLFASCRVVLWAVLLVTVAALGAPSIP